MSVAHSDHARLLRDAVAAGDRSAVSRILRHHPRQPSVPVATMIFTLVWTMGLVADQLIDIASHDDPLVVFLAMIVFIVGFAALGVLAAWWYWRWGR